MRLLTTPAPSLGGPLLALALRLLEACDLDGVAFDSSRFLATLVAVQQEVERRRGEAELSPSALGESVERVRTSSGGTTHVSVCDAEGNVASMTTSNGEGSGYLVPGTGIMLNNMLGEDDLHPEGFHASPPGQRVASMMCPSLVLDDRGIALAIGSGGSKRIRSTLLQVVSAVFDFGMSLQDAIDAPRVHWDGECVQVEPGFDAAILAEAVGDPRRGGSAKVIRQQAPA